MKNGRGEQSEEGREVIRVVPGIVVADRSSSSEAGGPRPRIAAFIWGGKVRPSPTLPFGRWKGAA